MKSLQGHIIDNNALPSLGGNQLAPNIDVFVLAGQSNACGYLTYGTDLIHDFSGFGDPYTDCLYWYNVHRSNGAVETSDSRFVALKPRSDDTCGPELSLGRIIAQNRQPVALVQVARYGGPNGQSTLADDGAATGNTWNPNRTGEYFDILVDEVTDALADIRSLGYVPQVKVLFWVQGESDCASQDWADAYEVNLNSLLSAFRTRFGNGVRAVITRTRLNRATAAATNPHATVRAAQEAVGLLPGNALASVDDFQLEANGSHYTAMEYAVFGQRLFFAYNSIISRQFPARTQYWHATVTNSLLQDRFPTTGDWRLYHHLTGGLVTLKDYQATGIIGGISKGNPSRKGFDKYTNGLLYSYQVDSNEVSTTENAFRWVNTLMSRYFGVSTIRMSALDDVEICVGGWEDSPKIPMETRIMLRIQGHGWVLQKVGYTNLKVDPNVVDSHETQATKFIMPINAIANEWHNLGTWVPTDSFAVAPAGGDPAFVHNGAIVDGFGIQASSSSGSICRMSGICFHGRLPIPANTQNTFGDMSITGDVQIDGVDVDAPGIPVPGAVVMWPEGKTAPTGWSICDGAAVSRTAYSALFSQLGIMFGAGDGTTTFNLPKRAGGGLFTQFSGLSQTSRNWYGMAGAPNGDIYAAVANGDIYMQTAGAGDFVALSQTSRNWRGMAAAPNGNVYAAAVNGDIYMQTAGTGDFIALSQTSREWYGMAAAPNGDIYAAVAIGDIYKQTAGTGNFIALNQTSREWVVIAAAPNGDVYAGDYNGDIYKQTAGAGDFVALSQTSREWYGMVASPSGDIYAAVYNGDIYIQAAGEGDFIALNQTTRNWTVMAGTPNGNIYAADYGGDIYIRNGLTQIIKF